MTVTNLKPSDNVRVITANTNFSGEKGVINATINGGMFDFYVDFPGAKCIAFFAYELEKVELFNITYSREAKEGGRLGGKKPKVHEDEIAAVVADLYKNWDDISRITITRVKG